MLELQLSNAAEARATGVWLDASGAHALVAVVAGNTLGAAAEAHYVHACWKRSRVVGKPRGVSLTAVGWNAAQVTQAGTGRAPSSVAPPRPAPPLDVRVVCGRVWHTLATQVRAVAGRHPPLQSRKLPAAWTLLCRLGRAEYQASVPRRRRGAGACAARLRAPGRAHTIAARAGRWCWATTRAACTR